MIETLRLRPSLWHCLWALPFFALGAGTFTYTLLHGLTHATDSLRQVVVPGTAELTLQPARYSVFLEEQSTVNGRIYDTTESISGLVCHLNSVQDGKAIAVSQPSANVSYTVNGRSGHSVLEFAIQRGGRYAFACDYEDKVKGPDVVVAVGSGVGEAISRTIVVGLAAFFGGGGAGVVVVLFVVLRREREKKRIMQTGAPQASGVANPTMPNESSTSS